MIPQRPDRDDKVLPRELKISNWQQIKVVARIVTPVALVAALAGLPPAFGATGLFEDMGVISRVVTYIALVLGSALAMIALILLIALAFYPFLRDKPVSRSKAEDMFSDR